MFDVAFTRMTPNTTNKTPITFVEFTSSPNSNTPKMVVPAVPPPAQTGYAMLTGKVFMTRLTKKSASVNEARAIVVGIGRVKPLLNLSPKTPEISKQTAKMSRDQV